MSYCVNCGVELTAGTKQCPLCSTVVINPNGPDDTIAKPPYPNEQEELNLNLRENTRMTALLISVVLALPAVICMVCDYSISRDPDWSNYVIASCALAWCFVVPPVTWKHTSPLSFVIFDTIAVAIFLYLIYRLSAPANNWFTPLALPLTLCSGVLIGIAASKHQESCKAGDCPFIHIGIYACRRGRCRPVCYRWSFPLLVAYCNGSMRYHSSASSYHRAKEKA